MTPDQFTIQEFFLDVGSGHQLYVQDWGNAKSQSVILYLHGGPGNGSDNRDKRKFDPNSQRVIFFDQRGSGRSRPAFSLLDNTTPDLIEDIEKIATKLNLRQLILVGGSWGSTLALLYAIKYPKRVKALVINGVYLSTKPENDWLLNGGWRVFFPDVWQEYAASVPKTHAASPSRYLFKRALGSNQAAAKKAVYAFLKMEAALLKLDERYWPKDYEDFEAGPGLIEIHYLAHNSFLEDNYILKNAVRLTMPVYLIQGRYDMVCPPEAAHNLNQALPISQLIWTINGHLKQHEANTAQHLILERLNREE